MSQTLRSLIVEDSSDDARLVVDYLAEAGFAVTWERVETAAAMRRALASQPWEVVISDYDLPQFDAPAALEVLRASGQDLPFIIVSGRVGEDAAVEAMRAGAHDYVMKDRLKRLPLAIARELREAAGRRERRALEARVVTEGARFRNLVESAFDWVWTIDAQARYVYASAKVQDILGYSPAEVLDHTPFEFMPAEEAARMEREYGRLAANRAPIIGWEYVNRHKDGRMVIVEISGVPCFAADGSFQGYHGMARDITARHATKQALRVQGTALEVAANAICILNADGNIEWSNPAFAELSGWSGVEAIGRQPRDLLDATKYEATFVQEIDSTLNRGRPWRGEVIWHRDDGSRRNVEMTITPLRNDRGQLTHCIFIGQDITMRQQLEAQRLRAQRVEAIGTLAGGIAHDLNNILAPILLVISLLNERVSDESLRDMIAMVQQSTQRGAQIIRQLLTFSRGTEGERISLQPKHHIREMSTIVRETFPRDILLRVELPEDLPTIVADPAQVHQVLLNLCVNARDAMPQGGQLTLRAAAVSLAEAAPELPSDAKAGPFVMLEVRDTGQGIPPELSQRIFDPFFTTKPIGKGSGLGLSTVQGIVRSHEGFITFQSEVGMGTTFRVFFPAEPHAAAAVAASAAPEPKSGRGRMILVVEDERAMRDALRLTLENHGYRVLLAVDGKDGLATFLERRGEIDLVLTDLMMPVMNGVALVHALRLLEAHLPVLGMTGKSEASDDPDFGAFVNFEVLSKPSLPTVLLAAIEKHLGAGKG